MTNLKNGLDQEIADRKGDVRALNQKVDDVDFELTEKLKKESEERNNKMKELENTFNESLERQRNFTDDFREKVSLFRINKKCIFFSIWGPWLTSYP